MRNTTLPILFALLLVVSIIGAAGIITAERTYEDGYYANNDEYDQSEYEKTIQDSFIGIPDGSHQPGNEDATFHSYVVPEGQIDEPFNVHHYSYRSTLPTADCGVENVEGAGIDRGNNRTGVSTDDSLVNAYEEQRFTTRDQGDPNDPPLQPRGNEVAPDGWDHRERLTFVFSQGEDSLSDPVRVNPEDELIFGMRECNDFPDQEGWFRAWIYVNGTGIDSGNEVELFALTNWVYMCEDCENRTEARQKFGPPGGDATTAETATPTATSGTGGTPTPDGTEPAEGPESPTPTSTAAGTDSPQVTEANEPGENASPTETTAAVANGEPQGDDPTPSLGGGSGFGVMIALLSLLAAGAIGRRRIQ
ncbi:hypothetical protein BRC85_00645 [Halobacteriales archaeon QS_1_69_70]|nr:MAG: hypothetical protein BRC85_00645 [Halobacteriales archaeon QS_1_69_70]